MKCISQAYHQRVCSAASATDVHTTNILVSFLTSPASLHEWCGLGFCCQKNLSGLQKNIMR